MAYNPQNNNGQATMANSSPVVIASDQSSVPVDTELPAAAALADATSNPTTTTIGSAEFIFNGTTWDRVKSIDAMSGTGANNTVSGILAVGTGPGYAHRYNPTALAATLDSASTIDVEGGNTMTWGILSTTATSGTVIFEGSADANNWLAVEVFDAGLDQWVSGQSIPPTANKVYHVACGGYRQIRMRVNSALNGTVTHTVNVTNSQQLLAGIDTGAAPHNFGYALVHRDTEQTTAQTGLALWTPTTGKKFVITDISISTGGTTAGIITLWVSNSASGDTTFTAGTDITIYRAEFAPSTTSRPGVVKSFNVPYVSPTANFPLRLNTSAAMTFYCQVNGYEI
jgi:hypothetical protein